MVNHGYPFGFWISMDKWLSISDVLQYLFLNQILSDKMHIAWKLTYFCIDSWIILSEIGNVSRNNGSFLITTNWIVLKFFNSSMDCYYAFKRKTKRKSLWMDLRNLWTNFKWLSIAVFWLTQIILMSKSRKNWLSKMKSDEHIYWWANFEYFQL
jgi:hypothetical protein